MTNRLAGIQGDVLLAVMLEAGIERTKAEGVIERAQEMLGHLPGPGPRNVSVHQQATVVEAGATMIGYQADTIG